MRSQEAAPQGAAGFPIVGIGASAGGLRSLQCFLEALPPEFGFAVVFLQHLSPLHPNLLPELLRKGCPGLNIEEVAEDLPVRPGRLYLSPPHVAVAIRDGTFHVSPAEPRGGTVLPIDDFFASLAESAGERAIGVVFSGAGTDGARGVQAIHRAGGTVFAEDPASAEFPGMPLAAAATGLADAALPPGEIAREIVKIHGAAAERVRADELLAPEDLAAIHRVLLEKTGYRFEHYKASVLGRRVRRRIYLRGASGVKGYLELLAQQEGEAAALAADLMIGVTSFFRDPLAWKALRLEVVRKLVAQDEDAPVRVWTPGCATGEEPYSVAMLLHQEFALAGRAREIQLFATDVNEQALERARAGRYPGSIGADLPPGLLARYFTCSDDGLSVIVGKEIRERVVFARQDLVADPPFSRLDLIVCRNLLIYLDPAAQEKCLSIFHYALKEGGFLFLGNAESLGKNKAVFKALPHKKCRIYQKLARKSSEGFTATPFVTERAPMPTARPPAAGAAAALPAGIAQEALLEEFAPAAVAIDRSWEILYHNGPTNRFLSQPRGAPTRNLLDLLPDNLRGRVRGAAYRSIQEGKAISIRASLPAEAGQQAVTLRISPLGENLSLVVFREDAAAPAAESAFADSPVDEGAVRQLEAELNETRAQLQTNIEQLKGLNEELQSSNEELQAANEELETSREELQSLNEELITVNAQLQSKIEEQEETNNDLNNFLASTNLPTMFLDTGFRVRRFTPAMSRLLTLIPADVGRSIADMSQEKLGPDLVSDARAVLENLVPVKRELGIGGAAYIRAIQPYRTSDNRIEGVVIAYSDVSELKRVEESTRHLASFPQLNPNPVLELSASGEILFSNAAAQRVLEELGMDKAELPAFLPPDMSAIFGELGKGEQLSFQREVAIKDRVFAETVCLSPQFQVARLYAFDITKRKRAEEALRESEDRLNRAQEVAHLGSWELDLVKGRLTWSDEVYRIFGLEPQEFGASYEAFLEAVHPDDRAAVDAAYSGSLREGRDSYEIEHRIVRRPTGEVRVVHERCAHLRDGSGRVVKSVGMVHDITERKAVEDQVQRHAEELRAGNEELTRLTRAMVGRELRMIELKKQLNEQCRLAGVPPPYPLDFEQEEGR